MVQSRRAPKLVHPRLRAPFSRSVPTEALNRLNAPVASGRIVNKQILLPHQPCNLKGTEDRSEHIPRGGCSLVVGFLYFTSSPSSSVYPPLRDQHRRHDRETAARQQHHSTGSFSSRPPIVPCLEPASACILDCLQHQSKEHSLAAPARQLPCRRRPSVLLAAHVDVGPCIQLEPVANSPNIASLLCEPRLDDEFAPFYDIGRLYHHPASSWTPG